MNIIRRHISSRLWRHSTAVCRNMCRSPSVVYRCRRGNSSVPKETSYSNYSDSALFYDKYRRAVGMDVVESALHALESDEKPPLSQFKVLDAGCGTGNYITPLLDLGIASVDGIEINTDMLAVATEKYSDNPKVSLTHGSVVCAYDYYADDYFDGIIMNQVIHHLDTDETRIEDFKNVRRAFRSLYSILKPGGVFILNTHTPKQVGYSYWIFQFMPKSQQTVMERYPSRQWVLNAIHSAGWKNKPVTQKVIRDHQFDNAFHYDFNGPNVDGWRKSLSFFSLVDDDELKYCRRQIRRLLEFEQDRATFCDTDRKLVDTIGSSTTFIVYK